MKVMTSGFMEFGDMLVGHHEYRVALVHEPYEIVEMTEKELDNYQGDWVDADFTGDIYIVKPFSRKELEQ
jgi:hypothetical protein